MTRPLDPAEPEEKPGWLYPLIIAGITAAIAVVFLWYLLGPSIDDLTGASIRPTSQSNVYEVVLGERRFDIPGNYIRLPAARRTGPAAEIELDGLLPDLHGFADGDEDEIRDVSPNSPLVAIKLTAERPLLTERERFERVYLKNADQNAEQEVFEGFTATRMSEDSGYAGQQVFSREDDGHFAAIVCTADGPNGEIGGYCLREMAWGSGLTATYGFRRGQLKNWKALDAAVKALLVRLEPAAARSSGLSPLFRQIDIQDRHIELVGRLAVLDIFRHDADEVRAEIDFGRVLDVRTAAQIERIVAEGVAQIGLHALHVLAVHVWSPDLRPTAPGGSIWRARPAGSSRA